jgi:hypothetical protein
VILVSLLMAIISFEFVESQFRGRNAVFSRRQIFSLGLAASALSIMFGLIISRSNGLPQRYDASTRNHVIENATG